jgi:hypothetical protein
MNVNTHARMHAYTCSSGEAFAHLKKEFGGLLDDIYHMKTDPKMHKVRASRGIVSFVRENAHACVTKCVCHDMRVSRHLF